MDKVGGEEREEEMYGESNAEIYIAMCKRDSQWEFAVWLSDRLKRGEEGDGRRSGREGHGCTYGWYLLMYDRKPQNSVKQLSFN